MTAAMEFCLLGPVVVRRDGRTIPVTHGKQQALLAALLLSAGRIVPVAELTEVLWGPGPPRWATSSLQNYVMHLRRSLADVGRCRITTESGGYQIYVGRGELDVESFQTFLSDARMAARDRAWQHTSTLLRRALSLWRGQPLCGVPSDTLALREIPRLAEMRFQALEGRIHADLHLGHHAEAIVELEQLVGTHPMRERFHALLMIALYQNGQQARALAVYQAVRGELMRELGVEPGHDLRTLQQQILRGDPAEAVLDYAAGGGRPPAAPAQGGAPVPRQLPCP